MQAYALQFLCKEAGYDPYVITRRRTRNKILQFAVWTKWKLITVISHISKYCLTSFLRSYPLIATQSFKDRYIPNYNQIFFSEKSISKWAKNTQVDQFVCGSDQIWNPDSWPSTEFAFAQFGSFQKPYLYSFAPSLGHAQNKFSSSQIRQISNYLSRFQFVSCRENSGVEILSKMTTNNVYHALDPTFLIDKSHYARLCADSTFSPKYKYIFIYLLDISRIQCEMLSKLAHKFRLTPVTFYPSKYKSIFSRDVQILRKYGIKVINTPSPENWLKAIKSADFVVTDSFHGTVFSLIFNTPFVSYINSKRGAARFLDLQQMFDIKHLFVDQFDARFDISKLSESIDWNKINSLMRTYSDSSLSYLKKFNS